MEKQYLKLLKLEQELKNADQALSIDQIKALAKYNYQLVEHLRWEQKKILLKL